MSFYRHPSQAHERDPLSVDKTREKALLWLARREYAAAELLQRMHSITDHETASKVLAQLQTEGLQSEQRYIAAKINAGAQKFGWARMQQQLKMAGVEAWRIAEEKANQLQGGDANDKEMDRCVAVIRKKITAPPATAAERAKLIRFLQGRGFNYTTIEGAIKRFAQEFTTSCP